MSKKGGPKSKMACSRCGSVGLVSQSDRYGSSGAKCSLCGGQMVWLRHCSVEIKPLPPPAAIKATIPFGKHKKWRLEAIPSQYLGWVLKACKIKDCLKKAIRQELTRRRDGGEVVMDESNRKKGKLGRVSSEPITGRGYIQSEDQSCPFD